jgi:predicted dehydrogenase
MSKAPTPSLAIGLIGFGFIGKLHANAYHNIPYCFPDPAVTAQIQAVLRSNPGSDQEFIHNLNIAQVTSNLEDFYARPIDAVDICTPNVLHRDQALEAIRQNKHLYCEKPLGRTLADAQAIAESARKSSLITHSAFMLRYVPAIRQMKAVIENGGIGQPYHFRAHMFHSSYLDKQRPMSWRLRHAVSGGGALADLGIHLMDLIRFLLGEVAWVQCQTRTFITERPTTAGSSKMETVDVDDWSQCNLGMQNGSTGFIEVTRVSGGTDENSGIEIIGSQGTVKVDFENPMTLDFFDAKRKQWLIGPQDFPPPAGMRPIAQLWPASKQSLGYMLNAHLASAYDFLLCIQENKPSMLNFDTALAAQEILEAAYLSASKSSQRINLPII